MLAFLAKVGAPIKEVLKTFGKVAHGKTETGFFSVFGSSWQDGNETRSSSMIY